MWLQGMVVAMVCGCHLGRIWCCQREAREDRDGIWIREEQEGTVLGTGGLLQEILGCCNLFQVQSAREQHSHELDRQHCHNNVPGPRQKKALL